MEIELAFCELGGRMRGILPMDIGLALCELDGQRGACAMEPCGGELSLLFASPMDGRGEPF